MVHHALGLAHERANLMWQHPTSIIMYVHLTVLGIIFRKGDGSGSGSGSIPSYPALYFYAGAFESMYSCLWL